MAKVPQANSTTWLKLLGFKLRSLKASWKLVMFSPIFSSVLRPGQRAYSAPLSAILLFSRWGIFEGQGDSPLRGPPYLLSHDLGRTWGFRIPSQKNPFPLPGPTEATSLICPQKDTCVTSVCTLRCKEWPRNSCVGVHRVEEGLLVLPGVTIYTCYEM